MIEHKCDKFGDKREGWNNCSICGKTDWKDLYKYKFETEEVINLITQNVELTERLIHEEKQYRDSLKGTLEEMFADEEGIDILTHHINSLTKKNRMLLFIQSHDFIFNTKWVETMRSMRRWGFEV